MNEPAPSSAPSVQELRQASLSGTFWSGIQQVVDGGVRALVYVVLARLLVPESFGIVAFALAVVELARALQNQGLTAALVQREALSQEHIDSAFWGYLASSIVAAGVCVLAADAIASKVGGAADGAVLRWLALSLPVIALASVPEALLRRQLQFRALALRTLAGQVVGAAIAVILAVRGAGVWSLVAYTLVADTVSAATLWILSSWRPHLRFSAARYRDLLAFGAFVMGSQMLAYLQRRADNLVIGVFLGAEPLGYYAIARQILAAITGFLDGALGPVVWSAFCRLQAQPLRLARAMRTVAGYQTTVTLPACVGIVATAPVFVPLLLGQSWRPAAAIVQAFGCRAALLALNGSNGTALLAAGALRLRAALDVFGVALSLTALLVGIPWGINGVAWALAGAGLLLVPVQLAAAARALPLQLGAYVRRIVVPALAAVSMGVVVTVLERIMDGSLAPPVLLATLICAGVVVYVGAFWWGDRDQLRDSLANTRLAIVAASRERT